MDEEKIAKLTVPEILNMIRRLLEELEFMSVMENLKKMGVPIPVEEES